MKTPCTVDQLSARRQAEVPTNVEEAVAVAMVQVTLNRAAITKVLETTDPEYRMDCENAALDVKGKGETFVGRDREIRDIMVRTTEAVREQSKDKKPRGTIVRGAPGVGKTTLLREARSRLVRDEGLQCIPMRAHHFHTPQTFSDEIKAVAGGNVRAWLLRNAPKVLGATTKGIDATIEGIGTYVAKREEVPVEPDDVQIGLVANVLDGWRRKEAVSVRQCLKVLDFVFPNGVVIFVDEAQDIIEMLDHEDPRKSTAAQIVGAISTKEGREEMGLDNTTGIFGGLSNTEEVLGKLGTYGLHTIQLQPMSRDEVVEYIGNGLRSVRTDEDDPIAEAIDRTWVQTLADEYGDWTRLAAAARQALVEVLERMESRAITDPAGWAGIITMADAIRREVYQMVENKANQANVPDEVVETLVWALAANGNRLTQRQSERLIELAKAGGTETQRNRTAEEVLEACSKAGVIDRATTETVGVPAKAIYSPIPSLLKNFLGKIITDRDQIKEWVGALELKTEIPEELRPDGT